MTRRFRLFATSGLGVLLITGGCGESDTDTATCDSDALLAPMLEDPPTEAIVDTLLPVLSWSYPDASCEPESYGIRLSSGPLFDDQIGGGTGNPSTSWVPGSELAPGREYSWGVQAVNGTDLGPITPFQRFFTGPTCELGSLQAPELLYPEDNGTVDALVETLVWQNPDPCLAVSYRIDLSTSLEFDGSPLNGATGTPSTRWVPGEPLTDCTRYYWRVAGSDGEALADFSNVRTFRVDLTGTCPDET